MRGLKEREGFCLDRYRVFLKQYNEWVDANKDRLEEESYKVLLKCLLSFCSPISV